MKMLFSSSFLSAIKVVSSAYLWLLIFLLAILIPVCASHSLAFCKMYPAYNLNTQGDNIQPFPICNQPVVSCPVLTVASWPAYRFLRRQVRWSGIPISWRIFQFVVIHTVKGFGLVSRAEVDIFLEVPCFFYVCNFISGSFAFSKSSLNDLLVFKSPHKKASPSLNDKSEIDLRNNLISTSLLFRGH